MHIPGLRLLYYDNHGQARDFHKAYKLFFGANCTRRSEGLANLTYQLLALF